MEEELDDGGPFICQQALEVVDVLITLSPPVLRDELADPDRQHVLIVGPVEDGYVPVTGNVGVDTPQKVVSEFQFGRPTETPDFHTLGIHPLEDIADGPVL